MPTLGEIAAINAGVFAGQETDPIKIASNINTLQRGQQALQKEQYDLRQEKFRGATDIATAGALNPAFDPGQIRNNPQAGQQALDWINQQYRQAKDRGYSDQDLFYLNRMRDNILNHIGQTQTQGPPAPADLAAAGQQGALGARGVIQDALSHRASTESQYAAGQPQITVDKDGKPTVVTRNSQGGFDARPLVDGGGMQSPQGPSSQPQQQPTTPGSRTILGQKYGLNQRLFPHQDPQFRLDVGTEEKQAIEQGKLVNQQAMDARRQAPSLLSNVYKGLNLNTKLMSENKGFKAGVGFQVGEAWRKYIANNPDQAEAEKTQFFAFSDIVKNNPQLAATDAGRQILQTANALQSGGSKLQLPYEVRNKAYILAGGEAYRQKLIADGLDIWKRNTGGNNPANAAVYESIFNQIGNRPEVFQVLMINGWNTSAAQKKIAIQEVLKGFTPEERADIQDRISSIGALVNGGVY